MRNSTGPTFASKIRAFVRLMSERMNQSANQRLHLQLDNSPIAVLGAA